MGEEHRHLGQHRDPLRKSLPARGGNAHDHVPEKERLALGRADAREPRNRGFLHREREHVGGAVFSAIDFVQSMNARIVG